MAIAILPFSFCLVLTFFSNEKNSDLHSQRLEERALKEIMIRNDGIYTLLGSKPVVFFSLSGKSMEEWVLRSYYDDLPETLKERFPFEEVFNYISPWKLWKIWMDKWEATSVHEGRYLFFRKDLFGYFVNTKEVICILSRHYDDFAKAYGEDFDPLQVTFEMPDTNSKFWNALEGNHYLWGLLLGYGEKNAYLFSLVQKGILPDLSVRTEPLEEKINQEMLHKAIDGMLDMKDLALPGYKSYFYFDQTMNQYKEERKKIIEIYSGKDFYKLTLSYLGLDDD